jgi:hypothetical protein
MPQSILPVSAINQDPYVKSKYYVAFPSTREMSGAKIGLKSVSIYNSWNNIDPIYNNQQFSIIFPNGAGNTTLAITIPAGIYTVEDLNNYLRDYFVSQNLYITNNTTSDITVYAQFISNGTAYSIDFVSFPLPTSTPSGFTNAGITWPTTVRGPQIVIATNNFRTITGYNAGTYPAAQQSTIYTKQSDNVPVISPVQSVNLTCDAVINLFSSNSSVIHSFTSKTAGSGQLIDSSPNEVSFIDCSGGSREGLTFQFTDQLGRPLQLKDGDVNINILIQYDPVIN